MTMGHFHRASLHTLQSQILNNCACALLALMGVASGGRAVLAFRLLLLFVLALVAIEYIYGSILDASPIRTYLYAPMIKSEKVQTFFQNFNISIVNYNNSKKQSVIKFLNITGHNLFKDITKTTKVFKNLDTKEEFGDEPSMPLCDEMPPHLGPIQVNKTDLELDWVEKQFSKVRRGGLYSPPNCTARHKVAIIVPYRDRQQHLAIFLNHIHPFLIKQKLEYGIYTVEQKGSNEFNRAKLMNVGFVESQKQKSWQCFIFHDIDLLPMDTRNLYSCPPQPRHMSASIDKFKFRLPYNEMFGGVSAMTKEQFLRVNGFSNKYWGWGGEDDDMFYRLSENNYNVSRYKMSIARYAMLDHKKSVPNPKRHQLLSQTSKTFQKDGLSTLEYEVVKVTPHHLYTHILVNIDERSLRTYLAKLLFGDG